MTWIIFFILTVILIGIELLVSWKRPPLLQGIRAASHILSVLAAFFITKACSAPLAKMSFASSTAADDLAITQLSELSSNISPIVSALVSPIAFLIIWALTGIAFYIIYKIIAVVLTKNMNLKERNVSSGEHAASMAIGGIMAILISLVIWMPLSGYVVTADNMVNALYADAEDSTYELPEDVNLNLEKIRTAVKGEISAYHFIDGATGFIFRGLTSYTVCGEKDNIYHDFPLVAASFLDTVTLAKEFVTELSQDIDAGVQNRDFEGLSDEDIQKLYDIGDTLDQSLASKSIVEYFLSGMSEAVAENNTYLNIELLLDETGENTLQAEKANDFIKTMLKTFENTSPDTVRDDIYKFAAIVRDIGNTAKIATVISGKKEDFSQNDIKELFENINSESSDAVADAIAVLAESTPDDDKNARGVITLVSDVYRAMGEAKADPSISEEEYKKEIDSIAYVFSMTNEKECDEQEMLKIYSESNVFPSAVKNIAAKSDEAIFNISDEYIATLEQEFDKYIAEYGSSEEISALAQLFGLTLN